MSSHAVLEQADLPVKSSGGLPFAFLRRGQRTLHAQCWAWGRDIKRPEGNLLLQYGFERLRPPDEISGCSQYTLALSGGITLRLWGFGVFIGQKTGIYLNRYEFVPRCVELCDAWLPDPFAKGPRVLNREFLAAFLDWAAQYENWVEDTLGRDYRRATFAAWKQRARPDLAKEWRNLSCDARNYLDSAC